VEAGGGEDETRTAWDLGPSSRTGITPSDSSHPSAEDQLREEVTQSIVVRVLVKQSMPESLQAQLIRALERQVTRRTPLIGWSDLFVVNGPLDLTGVEDLLALRGKS
jgi:hypothetical protein